MGGPRTFVTRSNENQSASPSAGSVRFSVLPIQPGGQVHALNNGIYESHRAYEQRKQWQAVFYSVISAYRDLLSLSAMTARNYDEHVYPRKLIPDAINYKVDIQNATAKALKNNQELILQWEDAAFDEGFNVSPSIVRECARVYSARELQPQIYLKKIRKGRPDRNPAKLPVEVAA
jgi:hypothetical protein